MKNKTLIIGASGAFGKELKKYYDKKKTIFTFYKTPIKNGIKFNATYEKIETKIKNFHDISEGIILYAEKNPNKCYENKKYSNILNVSSVKQIIIVFKKFKIKPIFMSTDLVFSGLKGNYSEKSIPNPKTLYGKQKLKIEKFIKNNFKNYLIFRLSKTYCFDDKKDAFLNWIKIIDKNDKIYCAVDQIYNPIFIKDAAKIFYKVSQKKKSGIFNIAGYKSFSRYTIFTKIYKEYIKMKRRDVKLVECKFNDLNKNYEKWPLNTSMKMKKVKKIFNFKLMSLEQSIKKSIEIYFKKKIA